MSRAWTWRHAILKSDLPATTRHVLLTVSCFMNDVGGGCYPSQEDLEAATGLSDRAVRTHLTLAEERGWIERREHGYRGQKWRRHEYFAKWPDPLDVDEGAEGGSAPSGKRSGTSFRKVRNDVPVILPVKGLPPNPQREPENAEAQDVVPNFETVWAAWPDAGRGSREAARGAYDRLSEDDRTVLARVIKRYATAMVSRWFSLNHEIPNLTTMLRERAFVEFDHAIPIDDEGLFVITPDHKAEWSRWLKWAEKQGPTVKQRLADQGRLVAKSRWPDGHGGRR